jgi:hypothetical protein
MATSNARGAVAKTTEAFGSESLMNPALTVMAVLATATPPTLVRSIWPLYRTWRVKVYTDGKDNVIGGRYNSAREETGLKRDGGMAPLAPLEALYVHR